MLFQSLAQGGSRLDRDQVFDRRHIRWWWLGRIGEYVFKNEGSTRNGLRSNAVRGRSQDRRLCQQSATKIGFLQLHLAKGVAPNARNSIMPSEALVQHQEI